MIAGLTGTVVGEGPGRIFLNVQSVEYELHVPLNVLAALQSVPTDEPVRLFVHHHFGESEQRLFGFLDPEQREFFVALQRIKGLGTGLALSLLSHLDGARLLEICATGDAAALKRIPRIGKTTAETLIFEINRRREKYEQLLSVKSATKTTLQLSTQEELAHEALLQLGYREKEALAAIEKVQSQTGGQKHHTAADLIRLALQTF
ncbi:MAG: Holliday junction branch migration protein RuvA [Spirochaetales bacterium]|nr:Holliday junction branch migration protein RuvA [Leptospiraceae bacterium]MCP5480627.1 Holliday junction branch migration protein RuvA [Spirochaetales bacterium]MCP5483979.1 Holliday junction branch migration protein RuvA [Spirochaetales bacterium]